MMDGDPFTVSSKNGEIMLGMVLPHHLYINTNMH